MTKSLFLILATAFFAACAQDHFKERLVPRSTASAGGFQFKHKGYIAPDELRTHDVNELAEAIVNRLHVQCDLPRSREHVGPEIGNDMTIIMMVHAEALPTIVRYGIPNQHLTRITSGFDAPMERYISEQELSMLRFPYSSRIRELLPKYSTFSVSSSQLGNFDFPVEYGNVALVFKDSVKTRTTWTYQDSLELPFTNRDRSQFPFFTTFYVRSSNDNTTCLGYCESQIWGSLSLADVDRILIPEGQEISTLYKSLGVPIYTWKSGQSAQTIRYIQSAAPVYPGLGVAIPTPLSLREIQSSLSAQRSHWVLSHILSSKEYGLISTEEILRRLAAPGLDHASITHRSSIVSLSRMYNVDWSSEEKLVAELAVREKTPITLARLREFTQSADPFVRVQAYYGLTEQDINQFKPDLLHCLSDENELVTLDCIAYSADFWGQYTDIDRSIARFADQSSRSVSPIIKEWISRLQQANICE